MPNVAHDRSSQSAPAGRHQHQNRSHPVLKSMRQHTMQSAIKLLPLTHSSPTRVRCSHVCAAPPNLLHSR